MHLLKKVFPREAPYPSPPESASHFHIIYSSLKQRLSSSPSLVLLLIFILALAIRVLFLFHYRMIETDGAYYGAVARLFADGHWIKACDPYWPPLFPFLTILPYKLGLSLEASGIVISLLASAGCVIVCFFLARLIAGEKAGLLAAGLAAVHPRLVSISQSFMTEPLYGVLVCGGLALFCHAVQSARGRSFLKNGIFFALSGALLGLSFLTRHEGAFYFLLLLAIGALAMIFGQARVKDSPHRSLAHRIVLPLFMLAGFAIVSFPYIRQVAKLEGRWTLGEKAEANMYVAYRDDYQKAGISVKRSDYDSITAPDEARQPGDYRVFEFVRKNPLKIIGRIAQIIPRAVLDKIPSFITWPYILLGLFGLFYRKFVKRSSSYEKLFALCVLLPVLMYSPLFLYRRFFIATAPIFLAWGAIGLDELRHRLKRAHFAIVIIVWSLVSLGATHFSLSNQSWPILYKDAGLWLKGQNIKPLVLSGRKPETSFYAGAEFRPLESQTMEELKPFLAEKGVTHLVVEDYVFADSHPNLAGLLDPEKAPPWLRPVFSATKEGHRLIVYAYAPADAPRNSWVHATQSRD
ncbi:MAG: glycosyltransferase family 39 protein [Candidatus Aminicenantales bacterium]